MDENKAGANAKVQEKIQKKPAIRQYDKKEPNEEEERDFKWYMKLVLPHVGLVLASILYAVAGAFVFYSVEMRFEHDTKMQSVRNVTSARRLLVDIMWNNSRISGMRKEPWLKEAEVEFTHWTHLLYNAFKKGFVKFQHVNAARTAKYNYESDLHNLTFDEEDYVWTPSSSIFFAWTTMATIGYGNVVPATMEGRIICVFFALFGTPLAILTIGDLGKFLSESTIAGYKRYKKWRDALKSRLFRRGASSATETASMAHEKRSFASDYSSFEDLLFRKAQVPVVVVFAILLIYISLGGLLFSYLEGWKYVDAFYFCFISLTTVGFGDMVPRRHAYLVVMLLYIGVGLAVTTMCIDLVGIHYLQKIHYFGRKFKGYDLLKLLRQRRMIERRLAMAAQAADIMQMYFDAVDRSMPSSPNGPKFLLEQEYPIHEPMVATASSVTEKLATPDWPIDNVEPAKSLMDVSPVSTNPSYYDRLNMYERMQQNNAVSCRSPSGPSISIPCSIATSPSNHERERIYAIMREQSWPRSPDSFKFEFPPPSPDYSKIAQQVRDAKRSGSCPGRYILRAVSPQTPTVSAPSSPTAFELAPEAELASFFDLRLEPELEESPRMDVLLLENELDDYFHWPAPLSPIQEDVVSSSSCELQLAEGSLVQQATDQCTALAIHENEVSWREVKIRAEESILRSNSFSPVSLPSCDELLTPCDAVFNTPEVALFHSTISDIALPLAAKESLRSARPAPFRTSSLSLPEAHSALPYAIPSAVTPLGMSLMEDWDSYRELLERSKRPRLSIPNINVEQPSTSHADESDEEVYPPSLLSPLDLNLDIGSTNVSTPMSSPPESILDFGDAEILELGVDSGMSTETEVEVSHLDSITEPPKPLSGQPREGPLFYHRNIPVFSIQSQTVETEDAVQSVMSCSETCLTAVVPQMVTENYCFIVDGEKLTAPDLVKDTNWWRPTGRPTKYYYSADLKTFQRVNIILVKGRVISARLVQTRTTPPLQSNQGQSGSGLSDQHKAPFLSGTSGRSLSVSSGVAPPRRSSFSFYSPPTTSAGPTGQRWNSSSSTNFYFGPALHSFRYHRHRHASIPTINPVAMAASHRPRSVTSFGQGSSHQRNRQPTPPGARFLQHFPTCHQLHHTSPPATAHPEPMNRTVEVPLECVYKVTRLYSFWKTCTSFHRIVTIITPLTEPHANPQFKRRLFVQYLWRNAKAEDKQRVQREYDPRKDKPLTRLQQRNPLDRKRTFHLYPLEVEFGTPASSTTTYSQPSSPSGDSVMEFQIKVGTTFRDIATYPNQPDSGRASLATASDAGNGPEEPSMLFHQNLPIYAVEDRTVGSERALYASFNCPTEFISQAPPTMVTENYCFVVDGEVVDVEALNTDVEWWKPTSRPTHYYHSEDFKTFRRVHIVTVRGRIVGARMRGVLKKQSTPPPPQRSPSTPTSNPGPLLPPAPPVVVHRNVPLANVFRVARYYSYWKTCAHFHRIITVITPVKEPARAKFKKRVFFQFLWHRDAKEVDKLRVAMEYSPSRQSQLLQPRGSSFSAAGPSTVSPHASSGSGGSNPPSGSVSPRLNGGDEEGPSSSSSTHTSRRTSVPASLYTKRARRTSSVFHL